MNRRQRFMRGFRDQLAPLSLLVTTEDLGGIAAAIVILFGVIVGVIAAGVAAIALVRAALGLFT